ncbi:3511_t:CDS:10, partial [Scutellospora calospora]
AYNRPESFMNTIFLLRNLRSDMPSEKPFHHRATLKQSNKSFKLKHATKGSLKDQQKAIIEGQNRTIVAVIPLCSDINSHNVVENIYASVEQPASINGNIAFLNAEFIILERNFIDIIDACKHLEDIQQKKRNDVKKSLLSFINYFFPDEEKIHEALNILRTICTQLPKQVSWREKRPYTLAEEISFDSNDDNKGTHRVTGYARGLIHLQNFCDFQLNQITSCPKKSKDGRDMAEDIKVLDIANPEEQASYLPLEFISCISILARESLTAENEPNFMENEQTWPTEEEITGNEGFRTSPWDPNENLPIDYGQFENYKRTKSRVINQAVAHVSGVKIGAYITLHIANVPKEVI